MRTFKTEINDYLNLDVANTQEKVFQDLMAKFPVTQALDAVVPPTRVGDKEAVEGLFLVSGVKDAAKSINFKLSNSADNFNAKIWKSGHANITEMISELEKAGAIYIHGKGNAWGGSMSIVVDKYEVTTDIDATKLLENATELEAARDMFIVYYTNLEAPYRKIIDDLIGENWELFSTAVAAKGMHHNYLGGLLVHTLEVLGLAFKIGATLKNGGVENSELQLRQIYDTMNDLEWKGFQMIREGKGTKRWNPFADLDGHIIQHMQGILKYAYDNPTTFAEDIDLNVIITGALIHDMGKIVEYKFIGEDTAKKHKFMFNNAEEFANINTSAIDMDDIGGRFGHINLGEWKLYHYFQSGNSDLPLSKQLDIISMISTHHAKGEWGSPNAPKTINEKILHLSDFINSRMMSTI